MSSKVNPPRSSTTPSWADGMMVEELPNGWWVRSSDVINVSANWAGIVANGHLGAEVLDFENLRAQNAVGDAPRPDRSPRVGRRQHTPLPEQTAVEFATPGRVAHEMVADDPNGHTALQPSSTRDLGVGAHVNVGVPGVPVRSASHSGCQLVDRVGSAVTRCYRLAGQGGMVALHECGAGVQRWATVIFVVCGCRATCRTRCARDDRSTRQG